MTSVFVSNILTIAMNLRLQIASLAPQCLYHDPAEAPTAPAPGTRTWITEDVIGDGRILDTTVPTTCTPGKYCTRHVGGNVV